MVSIGKKSRSTDVPANPPACQVVAQRKNRVQEDITHGEGVVERRSMFHRIARDPVTHLKPSVSRTLVEGEGKGRMCGQSCHDKISV